MIGSFATGLLLVALTWRIKGESYAVILVFWAAQATFGAVLPSCLACCLEVFPTCTRGCGVGACAGAAALGAGALPSVFAGSGLLSTRPGGQCAAEVLLAGAALAVGLVGSLAVPADIAAARLRDI